VTGRLRVLVCGTGFGRVYLRALERSADDQHGFELAGILARGSARSRALAAHYRVPLYTDPTAIGPDVDLACVVVPNAAGGGPGAQLAQDLLCEGIPVLLEHPVHAAELAACLRVAHTHRTAFAVTTFYEHLTPVRRFLAAARALRERATVTSVDASFAVHVAYDLLDIVGQALGGLRPWAIADPPPVPDRLHEVAAPGGFAHRCLDAVIAGVPATLRVHNHVDAEDPDHPSHLQHRVALDTTAGTLLLASTHGPVLWCPAMTVPRDEHGTLSPESDTSAMAGAVPIGPATAPGVRETFDHVWPSGVRHALDRMRRTIEEGRDPRSTGQYQLTLSRMWSDLTGRLGYPVPVHQPPTVAVPAAELEAAVRAVGVPV
jgi:pyochelin biosynthesis protein PchG